MAMGTKRVRAIFDDDSDDESHKKRTAFGTTGGREAPSPTKGVRVGLAAVNDPNTSGQVLTVQNSANQIAVDTGKAMVDNDYVPIGKFQDLLFQIFWLDLIVDEFNFKILLFSSSSIRVASYYSPPSWEAMKSRLSPSLG
jgi:hypothetical protein